MLCSRPLDSFILIFVFCHHFSLLRISLPFFFFFFLSSSDFHFKIPTIEGLVQLNEQTNPDDLGLNPNTVVVNFL